MLGTEPGIIHVHTMCSILGHSGGGAQCVLDGIAFSFKNHAGHHLAVILDPAFLLDSQLLPRALAWDGEPVAPFPGKWRSGHWHANLCYPHVEAVYIVMHSTWTFFQEHSEASAGPKCRN